jgi:hypothetical protein
MCRSKVVWEHVGQKITPQQRDRHTPTILGGEDFINGEVLLCPNAFGRKQSRSKDYGAFITRPGKQTTIIVNGEWLCPQLLTP